MIALDEVSFAYRTGALSRRSTPVLDRVTAALVPGSTTALTGTSGRGKSTLLYLCGLLLRPCSGRVVVADVDTAGLTDAQRSWLRARTMGFVFQDAALDSGRSVLDNVTECALYAGLDRREARRRALALLDRFGVALRADHRPGQVSGGQAQRVALCRALLTRPPVVLADEPTGNLDAGSTGLVLDAFDELARQGCTVVVATHDDLVVRRCDRAVRL